MSIDFDKILTKLFLKYFPDKKEGNKTNSHANVSGWGYYFYICIFLALLDFFQHIRKERYVLAFIIFKLYVFLKKILH